MRPGKNKTTTSNHPETTVKTVKIDGGSLKFPAKVKTRQTTTLLSKKELENMTGKSREVTDLESSGHLTRLFHSHLQDSPLLHTELGG